MSVVHLFLLGALKTPKRARVRREGVEGRRDEGGGNRSPRSLQATLKRRCECPVRSRGDSLALTRGLTTTRSLELSSPLESSWHGLKRMFELRHGCSGAFLGYAVSTCQSPSEYDTCWRRVSDEKGCSHLLDLLLRWDSSRL